MYIIEYLILVFDWLLALWHYLPLPWWQSESTALYTMFSATSRTCAKINCDNTKRHVTTVTPVKNTVLVCHTFCCLLVFLFPYYFYPYSIELFLFIWILTHNTCNSKSNFIKHLIKGREIIFTLRVFGPGAIFEIPFEFVTHKKQSNLKHQLIYIYLIN